MSSLKLNYNREQRNETLIVTINHDDGADNADNAATFYVSIDLIFANLALSILII